MIARRLRITGRVQGVWFRDWAVETARGLGIAGWVRNRADGSVEALAIGPAELVDAFVARCHEGPPSARVAGVAVAEAPVAPLEGFVRRATL